MISIEKCKKLMYQDGYSLITVSKNKVPNFSWKDYQSKILDEREFEKRYNYKGGIIKKDGQELPPTDNVGIVTGFNGVECIDVDLKVLGSASEKLAFWNEYIGLLKDNILDFEQKFVVAKTMNEGYHIIYRCETPEGNTKIAKLQGQKEYIIETRGVGGYIFIYEKFLFELEYKDIQFISNTDREILWEISSSYNHIEKTEPIVIPKIEVQQNDKVNVENIEFEEQEIKTWTDYDNRTSIFDLIGYEFEIVRQTDDKYFIKRNGANSSHSGYVFKRNGCMYLFSINAGYDEKKLLSPFEVYAIKNHNKDLGKAAADLYKKGYGSRIKRKLKENIIIDIPKVQYQTDVFPIDIFPTDIQNYITLCSDTLNNSIDYMGGAFLWMSSLIIGNTVKIKVKNGWVEPCSIWLAVIGMKGIGKTPSIKSIVFPLEKANMREIKKYTKEMKKYENYKALDKDEKKYVQEVHKPKHSQFIAKDVTLEALIDLHEESPNGIGLLKDELAGWFKDMNKYRAGSDLEHWLSSWNGESITLNRKTSKSAFVNEAFIPVLGGIQPTIFDTFYNGDNSENGFIDRMLFTFPDLVVDHYNTKELPYEIIDWYDNSILSMIEQIKSLQNFNEDGEITPIIARISNEANEVWIKYFNELTDYQNSDEENEYIKAMIPKQKSYTPRFALIINVINSMDGSVQFFDEITKDSMDKAIKLSRYFIEMAKKVKVNSIEQKNISIVTKDANLSTFEKIEKMYNENPEFNRKQAAILLNVSRQTIINYVKKITNEPTN
jgi:hypothetical protein